MLGQKPDPLPVQEVPIEQRPDRADVHHIAGQRIAVQGVAGKDVDLGMVAPAHHLELSGLGDLAGEADAPGAHDAPVLVELHQVRDILPWIDQPLLDKPVPRLAVVIAVVLQAALAGLVADRAVERVIQKQ